MHAGPLNLIKIKSTLIDVQCTQVGEVSIHNYLYCIGKSQMSSLFKNYKNNEQNISIYTVFPILQVVIPSEF